MIKKDEFLEFPDIGLFGVCNDKIGIFGKLKNAFIREVEETLKIKTYKTTVFGTNLIGLFGVLAKNVLFLPRSIDYFENELEFFKELKDLEDIETIFLETKHNAISNISIIHNNKALLSDVVKKEKDIYNSYKEYFDEVEFLKVNDVDSIGQLIAFKEDLAIASNLLDEETIRFLKEYFKLRKITVTTINFGSPFVRAGILVNKNGVLVGKRTTGFELFTISEAFEEK